MRHRAGSCILEHSFGLKYSDQCGLTSAYATSRGNPGYTLVSPCPVFNKSLVNIHDLKYALETVKERVRVIDVTLGLEVSRRDSREIFRNGHIPNSTFFDINNALRDNVSPLRMLPRADMFGKTVSDLGINNGHHVVLYGAFESLSAACLWWMFRVFGHENVHVLQGGLKAWLTAGFHVDSGDVHIESTRCGKGMVVSGSGCLGSGDWRLSLTGYQAKLKPAMYCSSREILAIRNGSFNGIIVDGRLEERTTKVNRTGSSIVQSSRGTSPTYIKLPWTLLTIDGDGLSFKSVTELQHILESAGLDIHSELPVVSVGENSITASVIAFALKLCGRDPNRIPVFDGNWEELESSLNSSVKSGPSLLL